MGKTQPPDCSISQEIADPAPFVKDVIFFVDNGARKDEFRVEDEYDCLQPFPPLDETSYNFEDNSEDESKEEGISYKNSPVKKNSNEVKRVNDDIEDENDRDRLGIIGETVKDSNSDGTNEEEENYLDSKTGNNDVEYYSEEEYEEYENDSDNEGRFGEAENNSDNELRIVEDENDSDSSNELKIVEHENDSFSEGRIGEAENDSGFKGRTEEDKNGKAKERMSEEEDDQDPERDKGISNRNGLKRKRTPEINDDVIEKNKIVLSDEELKSLKKLKVKALDEQLHKSLHAAFLNDWSSNHTYIIAKSEPTEEDEEIDVVSEEPPTVILDEDEDDDDVIHIADIYPSNSNTTKNIQHAKGLMSPTAITKNYLINQSSMNMKVSSVQNLSSSSLERKSLIIGGNVKTLLSANNNSLGRPVKAILDKGSLKALVKPTPGNGHSLLKPLTTQMQSVLDQNANSMPTLRPLMSKPSDSQTGKFIKLSDINDIRDSKSHDPTSVSDEKSTGRNSFFKISMPERKSLGQNNINNIKVLKKIPVPEIKSDGQTTYKIIHKSVLLSQTHVVSSTLEGKSLLKSSPTQSPLRKILKLASINSSSFGIPITSKKVSSNLRCQFCNILFLKPQSLKIHQIARHKDQLNAKSSPLTLPVSQKKKANFSPEQVCVSLNNGKNLLIVPKNPSIIKMKPEPPKFQLSLSEEADSVTFSDLLELERELKDRAGNCEQCNGGKWLVSDCKKHARTHPYGDENCSMCKKSFNLHRKYVRHLEMHAPGSPESISDTEIPEEILSD